MVFGDREEAGEKLGEQLLGNQKISRARKQDLIILGIPRGGVVVANRVASKLGARLSVVVTKKIGAPGHEELAVGAMDPDGGIVWDEPLMASLGLQIEDLQEQAQKLRAKIQNYRLKFKAAETDLIGKTVIVVDDGIATGRTMQAAVRYLKSMKQGPRTIIVAVPVGATDSVGQIRQEADEVVCLHEAPEFRAVGQFYDNFPQVDDEQVVSLLKFS